MLWNMLLVLIVTLASTSQNILTRAAITSSDFQVQSTKITSTGFNMHKNTQINAKNKKRNQEMQLDDIVRSSWYQSMTYEEDNSDEPNLSSEKQINKVQSKSPKVEVPETERGQPYYYWLLHYDAFNAGFQFADYWSNTSECYYRMTNFTFIQKPIWEEEMDNTANTGYFKVDNTTALIQNTSESLWYCTSMLVSFDEWVDQEKEAFGYSWGNYVAGFFNNLLANVISFNNIYTSLEENLEQNNKTGVWFDTGRLVRIILIFDPIEPVDELYNQNVPIVSTPSSKNLQTTNHSLEAQIQDFIQKWVSEPKKEIIEFEQAKKPDLSKYLNQARAKMNQFVFGKKDNEKIVHNPEDLLEPENMWEITKGFLNSTGITYGGNRTGCEIALLDIQDGLNQSAEYLFLDWYNFDNFITGIDEFLLVTYSLNGITFDCYYGQEESKEIASDYLEVFGDVDELWFNILYNMGQVYTQSLMLYTFFEFPRLSTIKDYWQFGYACGKIFTDLFYPNAQLIADEGAGAEVTDSTADDDEEEDA